jgi:hypothetical protein
VEDVARFDIAAISNGLHAEALDVAKKLYAESKSGTTDLEAMLGYDSHGNFHGPHPPSPTGWVARIGTC